MRKSPTIPPRKCEMCGCEYTPKGNTQKYCDSCRSKAVKSYKSKYYKKMFPDAKPKKKNLTPCCICGGEFSGTYDGKPYCNKHWLRMYKHGDLDVHKRPNTCTFDIQGELLIITTANGETILADASKYDVLSNHSWCLDPKGYAVANIGGVVTSMHRFLLGLKPGDKRLGDHKNRKKFDNRMKNLRICTYVGNARNVSPSKNSKSGELGIRKTIHGRYNVRIVADGKEHHIGNFISLGEAKQAREEAENYYHGEFASNKGTEE